jgi:hypothetical protein
MRALNVRDERVYLLYAPRSRTVAVCALPDTWVVTGTTSWELERSALLNTAIRDLGLRIPGSRVEHLVARLNKELEEKGIAFHPPVYLSDEWGCPDGTPVIGVPFYLADERLERIEAEHAGAVEGDAESMRYLRHEAGHAINYAFRLHARPDFGDVFGDYARDYREHYSTDPLSRSYVRHILGWYAQKHPDEDFAETFAVWLTPGLDWRAEYAGWPAMRKLEWVDDVMRDVGPKKLKTPAVTEDDGPVETMDWTLADHYDDDPPLALGDGKQFDADLKRIFATADVAPEGKTAAEYLASHEGELVARISYWAGVGPAAVRSLMRALGERAGELRLRVAGLEASTIIELTAFGTAVLLHWRYTHTPIEEADE